MRLLNIHTLQFKWFNTGSRDFPPYMILSHTWGPDEHTFEEHEIWLKQRGLDSNTHHEPTTLGFQKIKAFCRTCREDYQLAGVDDPDGKPLTRKVLPKHCLEEPIATEADFDGLDEFSEERSLSWQEPNAFEPVQWVWIDTCCIDKRSSAELSEAINSMYKWYENADICIAFLSDIDIGATAETMKAVSMSEVGKCRWWTRGWTLQELIAPRHVHFYDTNWRFFWTKRNHARDISCITSINWSVFVHDMSKDSFYPTQSLSSFPLAVRLSWGAERETTREEDKAYCLLGILGVNMPLLYGEGEAAFSRLQDVLMQHGQDQSLLAWSKRHGYPDGAVARSLRQFRECQFPRMQLDYVAGSRGALPV